MFAKNGENMSAIMAKFVFAFPPRRGDRAEISPRSRVRRGLAHTTTKAESASVTGNSWGFENNE